MRTMLGKHSQIREADLVHAYFHTLDSIFDSAIGRRHLDASDFAALDTLDSEPVLKLLLDQVIPLIPFHWHRHILKS